MHFSNTTNLLKRYSIVDKAVSVAQNMFLLFYLILVLLMGCATKEHIWNESLDQLIAQDDNPLSSCCPAGILGYKTKIIFDREVDGRKIFIARPGKKNEQKVELEWYGDLNKDGKGDIITIDIKGYIGFAGNNRRIYLGCGNNRYLYIEDTGPCYHLKVIGGERHKRWPGISVLKRVVTLNDDYFTENTFHFQKNTYDLSSKIVNRIDDHNIPDKVRNFISNYSRVQVCNTEMKNDRVKIKPVGIKEKGLLVRVDSTDSLSRNAYSEWQGDLNSDGIEDMILRFHKTCDEQGNCARGIYVGCLDGSYTRVWGIKGPYKAYGLEILNYFKSRQWVDIKFTKIGSNAKGVFSSEFILRFDRAFYYNVPGSYKRKYLKSKTD